VLTDWIVVQASRLAPSPFSSEVEEVIGTYAPPNPEADRQLRELTLVCAHALLLIPVVGLWAFVAWVASAASGHEAFEHVVRIGWALTVGLLAGMGLHLLRYYDAYIGKVRNRRRSPTDPTERVARWPRLSTDIDFLLLIAVSVAVAMIGAPG
jgi:hypothetical protein